MTRGLPVTAIALLYGCGAPASKNIEKAAEPVAYFTPDPAASGTIRGTVRYRGGVPKPKAISMNAEEDCERLHAKPVYDQPVAVDSKGGLGNAFVYLKSGLEGKAFAPAQTAVAIDQKGCQFVPRVVALRAGQTLTVRNSDPVSHNIHPRPVNNREWNQQQQPGAEDLQRRFAFAEVMIPVKCNVHAWMKSYIGVVQHPYFAVTPADGTFSLEDVPPGSYTIAVWHETLGELTESVVLAAKGGADVEMVFPARKAADGK